jgi:hypothetical protein
MALLKDTRLRSFDKDNINVKMFEGLKVVA